MFQHIEVLQRQLAAVRASDVKQRSPRAMPISDLAEISAVQALTLLNLDKIVAEELIAEAFAILHQRVPYQSSSELPFTREAIKTWFLPTQLFWPISRDRPSRP